mgnify:CR=1 FL=1
MKAIIETYYLEPNSKLVNHIHGPYGVDCWFEADDIIQHRCLTVKDFNSFYNPEPEDIFAGSDWLEKEENQLW